MSSTDFRFNSRYHSQDRQSRWNVDSEWRNFSGPDRNRAIDPQEQHRPIRLKKLQASLGYKFCNKDQIALALSPGADGSVSRFLHRRLEWLGDAVLEVGISKAFLLHYRQDRHAALQSVSWTMRSNRELRIWGAELNLRSSMSVSSKLEAKRFVPVPLSKVMEAVLGAVYLDGGLSPVVKSFEPRLIAKASRASSVRMSESKPHERNGERKPRPFPRPDSMKNGRFDQPEVSEKDRAMLIRRTEQSIGRNILKLAAAEELFESNYRIGVQELTLNCEALLHFSHLGRRLDWSDKRFEPLRGEPLAHGRSVDSEVQSVLRKRLVGRAFAKSGYEYSRLMARAVLGLEEKLPEFRRFEA